MVTCNGLEMVFINTSVWLALVQMIALTYGFSGEMLPYSDPNMCVDNEYFDSRLLKCIACSELKNLEPTEDKLACTCNMQSKIVHLNGSQFPVCEPCPDNQVPTTDKFDCLPCSDQAVERNDTVVCATCGVQEIRVERHYNGSLRDAFHCLNCTTGTVPSSDGTFCVPCSIPSHKCSCPAATHILLEGVCIPMSSISAWSDETKSYVIEYESGMKIDSYFLRRYLRSSVYLCKVGNQTACQLVANMCTLVMFHDDYAGSPCKMFQDSKHVPTSDSSSLPWLYYGEGDAQTVLSRKKITAKYSMDPSSKASNLSNVARKANRLNLTVIRFTPEGHMKAISSASGSFLQLCPDSWTSLDKGLRFGAQYQHSCTIPAHQLVEIRDTEFLDLYLQYWDGEESMLYAIPVMVLDKSANKGSDRTQWQLTRRFLLIDKIGGVQYKSNSKFADVPAIIRYVQMCTLRVKVRGHEEEGRIYPPLLVLKYGEVTQEDIEGNVEVPFTFSVEYEMDSSVSRAIEISLGVLSALAAIWSGVQTWSSCRRSCHVGIDHITLGKLIIFACGNLANVFFFVVACASFHTFIFYKGQSVVQVLLPSHGHDQLVRSYVISSFSLKIVEVIYLVWRQISIDIFFIDWERPRAQSSTIQLQGQLTSTVPDNSEQPVSIWRTYFVANEWNEIQTTRKISLLFQLILTIFVLKVLGLEHWAVADPELHTTPPEYMKDSPPSLTCRLAVGMMVYLIIYFIQWLFMVLIYERYVKNMVQEFVDICSMANISVFILSLENYGFYIHGRSVHGFADTDMQTILGQLQKEEEDLCGHRGLVPGTDQQTFQMAIPLQLRSYYQKVMAPVNSIMLSTKRMSMAGAGALRSKMLSGNMDQSIQAYHNMNKFLAAFLEHALKDLDYDVREKTFVESLLDIEFTEIFNKGILYADTGHSFDNVLFYGNEFTLATFDIFLFFFVDMLFHDFLLAAIITALIAKMLVIIRRAAGRHNMAKKTFIDERFLV